MEGESKTQWLEIDDQAKVIRPNGTYTWYENNEFGEGISPLNDDTFIELTWQDGKIHLLDRTTLETTSSMDMWPGVKEGWGITLDPVS